LRLRCLLRVARKLFAERGDAETATEEVVRLARVTRGALYHHFRDKQALFKAVVDAEQVKLATSIKAVAAQESDPWRALMAGCHAFLDACLDSAVHRSQAFGSTLPSRATPGSRRTALHG